MIAPASDATLADLVRQGRIVAAHRPFARAVVDDAGWHNAIAALVAGRFTMLGLWAEADCVHMALSESTHNEFAVLSVRTIDGRFASVGRSHPPAIRLERAIRDLWGLSPDGLPDARAWLDHGTWKPRQGMAENSASTAHRRYEFLPAEGESLHQIPVGPVHAGIIEPGHFRFTANGETVVRLEERLGYTHKGIEALIAGSPIDRAARLAGRQSGDSTVAYAFAFARAVEAAAGIEVPARALWLRALMAELERIANHAGDIGAICNDASFALLHAQFGHLREQVLRVANRAFGHRLMMDQVIPGGVARDLPAEAASLIRDLTQEIRSRLPELFELYDNTASLQDRTVGTGVLSASLARQYGCGGTIGRASGRRFDARRTPGYPPYDALQFDPPVSDEGDVDARVRIRFLEIEQSAGLVDQIMQRLPSGGISALAELSGGDPSIADRTLADRFRANGEGEGIALVEGFRGDVLVAVRIDDSGTIARCHLRDPSWFQWPLLEAVIEGNIVADFPLCNKSFNCSYSGHDG